VEHALNIALTVIGLAQLVLIVTLAWRIRRTCTELQGHFRTFITPKGPEQASPLADVVDVGADMFGRSITARLKATFMGQMSGQVRQEKAVEGAIAEDVARAAHPLAGTLLDAMPELRKTLRKNPGLLDFALSKLGNMQPKLPVSGNQLSPNSPTNGGGGKING